MEYKMKHVKAHHWLIAYILVAVFTFGHAFNMLPDTRVDGWTGKHVLVTGFDRGAAAIPPAMFWPLYWSVKAQEPKP
jgi:hypothetical protein